MKNIFINLTIIVSLIFSTYSISFAQTNNDLNCIELNYNLTYKKSRDVSTKGEVTVLQNFLKENGYMKVDPNGFFGPSTFNAVKSFQKNNKLSSSGYVGAITRARIKEISCGLTKTENINPVFCTMEYRSCSDGSPMPRDTDCKWREDKCKTSDTKENISIVEGKTPEVTHIYPTQANPSGDVYVYGGNFGKSSYVLIDNNTKSLISPNGSVSDGAQIFSFKIPVDMSAGSHSLQVVNKGKNLLLSKKVNLEIKLADPYLSVITKQASSITNNSAVLNGSGNSSGEKYWFEWGADSKLSNTTTAVSSSSKNYSTAISGLKSNTAYSYRAATSVFNKINNKSENVYGETFSFLTPKDSTDNSPVVPSVSISSALFPNPTNEKIYKITWSATNSTKCNFTGGEVGGTWANQSAISGFYLTKVITTNSTFGIYCTSQTGNIVTGSVTVSPN